MNLILVIRYNNQMGDYISDWHRRVKSVNERILLLSVTKEEGDDNRYTAVYCDILSQTDKQYKITIKPVWQADVDSMAGFNVSCTCPDFRVRHTRTPTFACKHIYWLGYKKMGYVSPEQWTKETLQSLIDTNLIGTSVKGRNDTCPICLENIDYNQEDCVCCESECYNAVHKICWIRYYTNSYSSKCVVCRSWGMPEVL